jgi:hypothetical protein
MTRPRSRVSTPGLRKRKANPQPVQFPVSPDNPFGMDLSPGRV